MGNINTSLKRVGEAIAALGLIGGLFAGIIELFGGALPPWLTPADAAAQQQTIESQVKALEAHQERSDAIQASTALTVFTAQLNQAQAQIDAAAKKGQRDYAAESLKAYATQAIMSLSAQPAH